MDKQDKLRASRARVVETMVRLPALEYVRGEDGEWVHKDVGEATVRPSGVDRIVPRSGDRTLCVVFFVDGGQVFIGLSAVEVSAMIFPDGKG